MRYYIIAGEASGDLHASHLMQGLKRADTHAEFRFWGGDLMAAEGGFMVRHYKQTAVMGFVEVVCKIKKITENLAFCKKDLLDYRPDLLVLVDYPGFNLKMAKFAKRHGIRVFYYIAPKVWAWKESRIKLLKTWVDKVFVIFPFEKAYFQKHGLDVYYEGNPLVDITDPFLKKEKSEDGEDVREDTESQEPPVIAILAGSRVMEIKFLLPRVLQVIPFFPDFQFVLAAAPSIDRALYHKIIGKAPIKIVQNSTYPLLAKACMAIISSGTATLEAGLLQCPQVVCYGGNPLSFALAKFFVKLKYISLVNLILNKPAVAELLQQNCNPQAISACLEMLRPGRKARRSQIADYKRMRRLLGRSGAALRIAKAMVQELETLGGPVFEVYFPTPLGMFCIASNPEFLQSCQFVKTGVKEGYYKIRQNQTVPIAEAQAPEVLRAAVGQINEYFRGERRHFELPLQIRGTAFQEKVWEYIKTIPYGGTMSYTTLAEHCGNPKATRAVGQASNANPFAVILPCHRVIGHTGELVGYGYGIAIKQKLLAMERSFAPETNNLLF